MEQEEAFSYTYSAKEQSELERIRSKYLPQQPDKMAELRHLDQIPGRKAIVWSLSLGIVGSLLLGTGMSLIMTDLGAGLGVFGLILGIAAGLVGLAMTVAAYPVYNRILEKERRRIAPEILRLTDELIK